MEISVAKKLIEKYRALHVGFINNALVAERYYRNDNDIMHIAKKDTAESVDPLRNADNRIPFNFHGLLVDQKASYLFTAPPLFDTKDDELNELIANTLGDAYQKKAKDLCINASNTGCAWVHYWFSEQGFNWGVIPSEQICPIFTNMLERKLVAALRMYKDIDDEGNEWEIYEIWNDKACECYRSNGNIFEPFKAFTVGLGAAAKNSNTLFHSMGAVPFIQFPNNNTNSNDLYKIKPLIDAYDKTFSGFLNDLDDVQQVIFVLTNYGGENLKEFLQDLKYYKAIQIENNGEGDKSGVSTLSIDIPVDAREKMLELTRKAIFDLGQGVDPQQQGIDRTSGVAMKFLYSLLELKAGLLETEFRLSFGELVRAICRYYGKEPKQIIQIWTRTAIRNDSELVDMCQKSAGIISEKTLLQNHPFVENAEDEQKEIEEEKSKAPDPYSQAFNQAGAENNE